MVIAEFSLEFEKILKKLKNEELKRQLKKQIGKIIQDPEIGKPMMYKRKGTRELYVSHFRLSYGYLKEENKIVFLDFYHKDEQ